MLCTQRHKPLALRRLNASTAQWKRSWQKPSCHGSMAAIVRTTSERCFQEHAETRVLVQLEGIAWEWAWQQWLWTSILARDEPAGLWGWPLQELPLKNLTYLAWKHAQEESQCPRRTCKCKWTWAKNFTCFSLSLVGRFWKRPLEPELVWHSKYTPWARTKHACSTGDPWTWRAVDFSWTIEHVGGGRGGCLSGAEPSQQMGWGKQPRIVFLLRGEGDHQGSKIHI